MLQVALREFLSVVATKGFILGIVLAPAMVAIAIVGVSLIPKAPGVTGRVIIVDRSGVTSPLILQRFGEDGRRREADADAKKMQAAMKGAMGQAGLSGPALDAADKQVQTATAMSKADAAVLTAELAPEGADIEKIKAEIRATQIRAERKPGEPTPSLALVIIPAGAVKGEETPGSTNQLPTITWQSHEIFVNPQLDFELQSQINRRVGDSIVDARIASDSRFTSAGLSPQRVRELIERPQAEVKSLTKEGEKASAGALQILVPVAFMLLLMMSVLSGGAYLMTALVEEKSSRVMEVLLSAVSPMQLMVGKIIGMMGVAILILVLYGGLGMAGLIAFALADLVPLYKLVWLVIFFILAFFTVASLMAAIGAAVNDMREAQTLQSPLMMIIMLPWLLWMPISRAPNSGFATAMSFCPGLNPFVMVIRLGGSEPMPSWQLPVSALIALITAIASAWASAKIFRIGVLMYGKPPNFATLIKWVRMA